MVRSAPCPADVPPLAPSPPWTGWDHSGPRLWPDQDDVGRDLNGIPGPAWVDDAARRVRERLSASAAPAHVGHGDSESQNIRWSDDGRPLVVHDWDSVIAQPEEAIVGLAAAVWPAAGAPGEAATVAQSAEFIASYQQAAGRPWAGRRYGMPGRQGCGSACSTPRRTRPTAAGRSSIASPARYATGWPWRPSAPVNAGTRPFPRLRGNGRGAAGSGYGRFHTWLEVSAQSQICSWVPEPP